MNGTLSRKTEPHQKCSSSQPPTIGPSAPPAANPPAQTAKAVRLCSRSVNVLRSNDNVDGISVAPKIPRATRAAMSAVAESAKAANSDTRPNRRSR